MNDGDDGASPGLREIIDGGTFRDAARRVARLLRDRPGDAAALRRLGDLQRQEGDLDAAAETFRRLALAAPGDATVARLAALLTGEPASAVPPLPTRFVRIPGFLPGERVEELRAHVRARRGDFRSTAVKREDGDDEMDHSTRRSSSLLELGDAGEWMDTLVGERIPEFLQRLGMEPFDAGIRSCKVSAYHDGHFFHLHQDKSTGAAATRVLGFLYYFEFAPRRFRGGELLVYDRDPDTLLPVPSFTTLRPEHNSLVVIPSNCWHEVLPVVCADDDWFAARFTYSGWIHDEALLAAVQGGEGG